MNIWRTDTSDAHGKLGSVAPIKQVFFSSFHGLMASWLHQHIISLNFELWCTPTKHQTSCTGLLWDKDNWSWHRAKKKKLLIFYLLILRFLFCLCFSSFFLFLFFFLHTLICFLSPPCNFWMIFKHFPTKNSAFSAACHIPNDRNRKL